METRRKEGRNEKAGLTEGGAHETCEAWARKSARVPVFYQFCG